MIQRVLSNFKTASAPTLLGRWCLPAYDNKCTTEIQLLKANLANADSSFHHHSHRNLTKRGTLEKKDTVKHDRQHCTIERLFHDSFGF